jgi:hypothetical protein
VDQWNTTEEQERSPHNDGHLIFDKGAKNTLEKRQPLLQMMLGKLDIHM